MSLPSADPPFLVRQSSVHGSGVFATRPIARGTRLLEYVGERISHAEADRRYADKADDDNHTFLFTVDASTVIDGGVGGNEARYLNHGCDPNCETVVEQRRIYIEALRDIAAGEELVYDYRLERDADDPPDIDAIFGCRCGAERCRGTMLLPPRRAATRPRRQRRLERRRA